MNQGLLKANFMFPEVIVVHCVQYQRQVTIL